MWSKQSRHERGYGAAWDKLRKIVMHRDMFLCQTCREKGRATTATAVDHIKPKTLGGTDDLANLQAICTDCHTVKTQQEAAVSRGSTLKPRLKFDANGQPIW